MEIRWIQLDLVMVVEVVIGLDSNDLWIPSLVMQANVCYSVAFAVNSLTDLPSVVVLLELFHSIWTSTRIILSEVSHASFGALTLITINVAVNSLLCNTVSGNSFWNWFPLQFIGKIGCANLFQNVLDGKATIDYLDEVCKSWQVDWTSCDPTNMEFLPI